MTLIRRLAPLAALALSLSPTLAFPCLVLAATGPASPAWVPGPLRDWVPWALHGREADTCPPLATDAGVHLCAWPTSLALDLNDRGGTFAQEWELAREDWAALPGDASRWPEAVAVDGTPAAVVAGSGAPRVRLAAGKHRVQGTFRWEGLPEALPVPPATGVIALVVNAHPIELPAFDRQGRLWLQRRAGDAAAEDRLEADVARLVRDTVPLQVLTRLRLRVSGQVREVLFPGAVAPDVVPVSIESPLPARLEPDGGLRVQVRPGDWILLVGIRHAGPLSALKAAALPEPWPRQETWAFEAQNDLHVRELGGTASPLDPQQTTLPDEWRRNPTFLVLPGQELTFKEVRRGDPQPAPDRLALARSAWLSMDGASLTFRDQISGVKNTGWRLEIREPLEAGRVAVGGAEQLITRRAGSPRAGVELRQGDVQLVAESTMPRRGVARIPAVGWEQDFSEVRGVLNLPPGWRLVALTGADRAGNTWVARWTLLDLFLVLIFGLAIWRLWGSLTGLAALATLALTWHEPGAPTWSWVPFLVATALERVVPSARVKGAARLAARLALLAIVALAVPFAVNQARTGLFPQLAHRGGAVATSRPEVTGRAYDASPNQSVPQSPGEELADKLSEQESGALLSRAKSVHSYAGVRQLPLNLPNAAIQTGRGLPEWQWERVDFSWNGPVRRDETLRLLLIGPRGNLALAIARILLTTGLLLAVGGLLGRLRPSRAVAAALAATLLLAPGAARAGELPEQAVLDQLAQRLLAPQACAPECADVARMTVEATPARLTLSLEVHAAAEVGVPLPSNPQQWMPDRVTVGGAPARGVLRRDGQLWLLAPRGVSKVAMSGPLPRLETVLLPLPLRPHRVETALSGWTVEGVRADGSADEQLQLSRVARGGAAGDETLRAAALPPFVQVERTLRLGLDWMVETVVRRVGPPGSAVVLAVPLLPGESVTLEGVRAEGGRVLVNMGPSAESFAWTSLLAQSGSIVLSAGAADPWFEVWRLDASPIWHVEASGIPVVHHQRDGRWLPEWRPWPGEQVVVAVSRPEGVPGQTVTIDRSRLALAPGNRSTEAQLTFTMRGSQGGQQALTLPAGAELLDVSIEGKTVPIRAEGSRLTLPVVPGAQTVAVRWRTPGGMAAVYRPELPSLGIASVNATTEVTVPGNRWVWLTGGPLLGPAVLWWGVLAIIALAALLLARVPGMPLNAAGWVLLGVGLSQAHVAGALVVVGWLLALRARRALPTAASDGAFNAAQVLLAGWTAVAAATLVAAVAKGLLGYPDLQIEGNGSHATLLRWYSDHSGATLPALRVLSAPLWLYRLMMLGWSLWLAFALLRWLRFGWESFSTNGCWRKVEVRFRAPKADRPQPAPTSAEQAPRDEGE